MVTTPHPRSGFRGTRVGFPVGLLPLLLLAAAWGWGAETVELTSSYQTAGSGYPLVFRAAVITDGRAATQAGGTVTFLKGSTPLATVPLVAGVAYSAAVPDLPVGDTTISARYSGAVGYAACTGTLVQSVFPAAATTFANGMMSLSIAADGTISSVKCVPTGTEMKTTSAGFFVYHQQTATTVRLTRQAPLPGNRVFLWSDDGTYAAIFQITCPDRYFTIELVHASNDPRTGDLDAAWPGHELVVDVNFKPPTGYALQHLKLNYMTSFGNHTPQDWWYHNGNWVNIHWQDIQYSQCRMPQVTGTGSATFTKTVPEPMGAVGFYLFRNDAEHDDILAEMWSREPAMVRPNQANQPRWTKADVLAWLDRYERELGLGKTLCFKPAAQDGLAECRRMADRMQASGFDSLMMWLDWGGFPTVDSINRTLFPRGDADLKEFQEYCRQRGISLILHAFSGHVELDDPVYGALSPNGIAPQLSRWATGTLLDDIDGGTTAFAVRPDPGCGMLVSPPPWNGQSSVIHYPPYFIWDQGIISIDNDIMTARASTVDASRWQVGGISHHERYAAVWGKTHKAGARVDFLNSYYGTGPMVDSRSDLVLSLAERFAHGVVNRYRSTDAQFDGREVHFDLGTWGYHKFSTHVLRLVDHPVTASYGGTPAHGHFEDVFRRVQRAVKPVAGTDVGYFAYIRPDGGSMRAESLDEINYAFGRSAATAPQQITLTGSHIGVNPGMIDTYGLWDQAVAALDTWNALAPYLDTAQRTLLTTWSTTYHEPAAKGGTWTLTPRSILTRPAVDEKFFNMQEYGPVAPRQFLQVGKGALTGLVNEQPTQIPEIRLRVLPRMTAANPANMPLMPTVLVQPAGAAQPCSLANGVLTIAVNNAGANALVLQEAPAVQDHWTIAKDLSAHRGMALTVVGDGKGAQLVLKIGTGGAYNREYVVDVDFTGERTIEIPHGEVMWQRKSPYGFANDYGTVGNDFSYASVTRCQVFLGYVPANVSTSLRITNLQAMAEDRTVGLVDPTLTLNGVDAVVSGTIPWGSYLVHRGGGTAQVYDGNWHFVQDLAVSGGKPTAVNGSGNTFSVQAAASSGVWLEAQLTTTGTPWTVAMPTPIRHYRFEGDLLDARGNAPGTAFNGPTYVPGREGASAIAFNGVDRRVDVPDAADLHFTATQSFTLSAWVRLNRLPGAWAGIATKGHGDYGLWVTPDHRWTFGGTTDLVSLESATVGEWHLLTAVQDGANGQRKFYVDGELSCTGAAQAATGTTPFRIGATSAVVPGEFLDGCVDDVRIYPGVWSAGDIRRCFRSGRPAVDLVVKPARSIGVTTATISAALTAPKATWDVYACWGPTHGGTSESAWAHVARVGTVTDSSGTGLVDCPLSDLPVHGTCWYTFFARSGSDMLWGANALSLTTLDQVPTASGFSVTTPEDTAVAIPLQGAAPSGRSLFYRIITPPAHGRLDGQGARLSYTPAADYSGQDTLAYAVSDGDQFSAPATVSITITPVDDPPTAESQAVITRVGSSRSITLHGTDPEGDRLTYRVETAPLHGTLGGTAPDLTYVPQPGYSGNDSFTFRANDGSSDSSPGTVSIIVRDPRRIVWSRAAVSGDWTDGRNWVGGVAPAAGDEVELFGRSAGGAASPVDNAGYAQQRTVLAAVICRNDTVDGSVDVALRGTLWVDAGGIVNNLSSGTLTVPRVEPTAPQTWTGSGPIRCGSLGGSSAVTFNVTGGVQIDGRSTADGGITVLGGNLTIGDREALGAGTLTWNAPAGAVFCCTAPANATTGIGTPIRLARDLVVQIAAGNLHLAGALSGPGRLTAQSRPVNGGSRLFLSGSNSHAGGTTLVNAVSVEVLAEGALGSGPVVASDSRSNSDGGTIVFNIPTPATFANDITNTPVNNPYAQNLNAGRITLAGTLTGGGNGWARWDGTGSDGGFVFRGTNTFTNKLFVNNTTVWSGNRDATRSAEKRTSFLATNTGNKGRLLLLDGVTNVDGLFDCGWGSANTADSAFTLGTDQIDAVCAFSGPLDLRSGSNPPGPNTCLMTAAAGAVVTFSGAITQTAKTTSAGATVHNPLTKVGPGTVVFAGTNSFGGTTTIAEGTLQIGNGGATGTLGVGTVVNNGRLVFDRSDAAYTCGVVISGPGELVKAGSGIITLVGTNTYSGPTTVGSGTLRLGQVQALPATALVDVATSASLALDYPGTMAIGSLVVGGVSVAPGLYGAAELPGRLTGTGRLQVAKILTYGIHFEANGADGGTVPPDQAKTHGQPLTIAGNSGGLVRSGHRFTGWNTAADGRGVAVPPASSYAVNAPLTLYAVWTPLTFTVEYFANGAEGGTVPSAQSKGLGQDVTLATNLGGLVRTGYRFTGWNTAADGSGTAYGPGSTYALDQAVTLYAAWTPDSYPVVYLANGADGGAVPPSQSKIHGQVLILAGNPGSLTRKGFQLVGWNTAADGSGAAFSLAGSYGGNSPVNLHAQWRAVTYPVIYAGNGADGGTPPPSQAKIHGQELVLAGNTGGLARSGYRFAGWNTAADGSGSAFGPGAVYPADQGATLYAIWLANTYAIVYSANGGDGGAVPPPQTKTHGQALTLAGNPGGLARNGYQFGGWNTAPDGGGTGYAPGAVFTTDGAATLFAVWLRTPVVDPGSGSSGGSSGGGCGAGSGMAVLLLGFGLRWTRRRRGDFR